MPIVQDVLRVDAFQRKRLSQNQLTNASVAQFGPTTVRTEITSILLVNTDSQARTATVRVVPTGGADTNVSDIISAVSIPATDFKYIIFDDGLALEVGDTVKALASASAKVNCMITGRVERTTLT